MSNFNPLKVLVAVQPGLGGPYEYEDLIKEKFPGKVENGEIIVRLTEDGTQIPDDWLDTHIIGTGMLVDRVDEMKDLQWIMTFSAGYDHWVKYDKRPGNVPVTHLPGGSRIPVAEYAVGLMLSLAKKFPSVWSNQLEKKFERIRSEELYDKTLGVIGRGGIGREVAKRGKAFEMYVMGTDVYELDLPYVDEMYLNENMDYVIKNSDFLVLACPETEETYQMMNEERFKMMKNTAYLINTARGTLVVKEALLKALHEGWIAGAAQDTHWIKPPLPSYLPPEDELWDAPNIIITPHISQWTERYSERFGGVFVENIERFLNAQSLVHVAPELQGNQGWVKDS